MPPAASLTSKHPVWLLERAHRALPRETVSIGWLLEALDEHASYLIIFVFGLLGALPAASLPAALVIGALAIRIAFAQEATLPSAIASREVRVRTVRFALNHAIAVLHLSRRLVPRSAGISERLRPVAGAMLLLLAAAMLIPIPLSNVLPALAASALALAMLENSRMLFLAGTVSACVSLMMIAEAVGFAVRAIGFA